MFPYHHLKGVDEIRLIDYFCNADFMLYKNGKIFLMYTNAIFDGQISDFIYEYVDDVYQMNFFTERNFIYKGEIKYDKVYSAKIHNPKTRLRKLSLLF